MIKKIIISRSNNIAAIVQNDKVQELIFINDNYQLDNIYIGIVHTIFTSINAAFIRLNRYNKSGFIHVSDTKNYARGQNLYSISDSIHTNQVLLVQIIKESNKNKGPRLTANIHLSGKYIILMPFNNTICIANTIYDHNERAYLKALGILIKQTTAGLLFKKSALGVSESNLIEDFQTVQKQWAFIQKSAIHQKPPTLIFQENNIINKIIKEYYDQHVKHIIIDCLQGLTQLEEHKTDVEQQPMIPKTKIDFYKDNKCILNAFHIKQAMIDSLHFRINLPLGGYIIIETSEALTIVDVNSGSFSQSNHTHETILKTNCLAASEIADQLRIRNINGIILVDFIDMKRYKDQILVLEHFHKVLSLDNAKPQIIQLSELGLVEVTRRRTSQSLSEVAITLRNKISTCLHINQVLQNERKNLDYVHPLNIKQNTCSILLQKRFTKFLHLLNPELYDTERNLRSRRNQNDYIIPVLLYRFTIGTI